VGWGWDEPTFLVFGWESVECGISHIGNMLEIFGKTGAELVPGKTTTEVIPPQRRHRLLEPSLRDSSLPRRPSSSSPSPFFLHPRWRASYDWGAPATSSRARGRGGQSRGWLRRPWRSEQAAASSSCPRGSPSTRQQWRLIPSRQRANSFGETARLLPSQQHVGSSLMGAELAASSFRHGALDLSHDTEKIRYDRKKRETPVTSR